ncbi:MAG: DUF2924 domain-containing protein [Sorangiineae bacterium PRO1]|nr:DUF2924 domain-containing protein [Sorangiineae bacterium PRO1]
MRKSSELRAKRVDVALGAMTTGDLRDLYARVFGVGARSSSKAYLRKCIALRMQEQKKAAGSAG